MKGRRFYVLGPLMGGYGSKAFLGQELSPSGRLRPAVLIFLPKEVLDDDALFERVRQETKVAVRLDHINIITILGLVKLEDGYARVVEFADGESLRSLFARARELGREIPESVAAAVLSDACLGVHHAHQAGLQESGQPLLHLAVRPETVLVTFRGIAMVTGYGTATIMEKMRPLQDDGYAAPELVSGGRQAGTVQTDVFGLGVLLLEALSGEAPANFPEARSDGLEGIARKAMSPEPGERFDSALQLREALLQEIQPATKREVSDFMSELFPDDLPQIQGRKSMLKQGQLEHDADPPELSDEGPPESVDLVWRYPIREVSGPAPAPPAKPKKPAPAAKPQKPALAVKPPEPAPATKPPEPAPAAKPPEPTPAAQPPEPAPAAKPPESAPATRRPAAVPPPPFPERKSRRKPALVVLVIVLVAAAFALGLVLSGQGSQGPATTPPAAPAPDRPAPPPAMPPVVKIKDQKKTVPRPKKTKRKSARRSRKRTGSPGRSSRTGFLNVVAPRGCKVYVRGRMVGRTPLKRFKLAPGRHKVVVVKPGNGAKYKRMVPIRAGQEMTLTVEFL